MALGIDTTSLELPAGEPWSGALVAMMEVGLPTAVATIVAIADSTVSMYTSTGGGVIGAGAHVSVRDAAQRFRLVAADARSFLEQSTDFPLPQPGEVRFQVRTADGGYSGVATEESLRTGRHPLAALYAAGQDLLTEIRLSTPQ